ncbi:transferrin-binding protein-like solute binding protein [Kingella negevensis]|uniref:transferrin-binding protein-like solute binding protein n=1 Tax=Kingella negevensis TaxID=1522312 RepID=UPI002551B478|nr:transferrin-binding protein-like solute binding protein [Kingella negevensis]MDK4684400.1 transferrin-binding protein-like solute binding protein [Kingella negevensis]MDK4707574.1 transferrin-binding protein-like solute binding protein [Kingella negevensis]MDK4709951.1 transferrin-binding protein-like solute binding protein [Kingella negevensis]
MNKKTIVLVCTTLFGLAACGGGGGGHHTPNVNTGNSQPLNKQGLTNNQTNNKNSSTNQTSPNNQTNNKNTSNNSKPTYTPTSEYKGSVTVSNEPDTSKATIKSITNPNLDKIVVDGHEIVINYPGVMSGTFTTIRNGDRETIVSGKQLKYAKFGSHETFGRPGKLDSKVYTFAIGEVTPTTGENAVPATGKATYKGSTVMNVGGGSFMTDPSRAKSHFDVDFGSKTISGYTRITTEAGDTLHNVPLEGKINGATFSGTKDKVSMQGHFFGPKAAELGGVFKGTIADEMMDVPVLGSFGATKQ